MFTPITLLFLVHGLIPESFQRNELCKGVETFLLWNLHFGSSYHRSHSTLPIYWDLPECWKPLMIMHKMQVSIINIAIVDTPQGKCHKWMSPWVWQPSTAAIYPSGGMFQQVMNTYFADIWSQGKRKWTNK